MKYCCDEFMAIQKWKPWIRLVKLGDAPCWVMGHPDQTGVMFISFCPFCGNKLKT